MPMFSVRNTDAISTGHVVNVVIKNLVLEANSELQGCASRGTLRHKVQGARHKEKARKARKAGKARLARHEP